MVQKTIKIFVKNPEIGKVKTRLAASVGDKEALSIYQNLLGYTKQIVSKVNGKKEVWYSKFLDENDLWENDFFRKNVQQGEDLGARMKQAFEKSFLLNEHELVILIGSDCAELETAHINEAFEKLKKNDLVIGPAKDGGYYLIGMSKFSPEVFDEINWSTSKVLEQTIRKINEHGASFYLLEALNDVDELEDWERVKDKVIAND